MKELLLAPRLHVTESHDGADRLTMPRAMAASRRMEAAVNWSIEAPVTTAACMGQKGMCRESHMHWVLAKCCHAEMHAAPRCDDGMSHTPERGGLH